MIPTPANAQALTRRALLRAGLGAAAGLAVARADEKPSDGRYREAALQAARWVQACKVVREPGATWPADPARPQSVSAELYSGTAGVVFFLLEAHRHTGEAAFIKDAAAGADHLLGQVAPDGPRFQAGLYTGAAGIGFCLEQAFQATKAAKYRDGVGRCVRQLRRRARKSGAGVEWNESTDVIAGGAGVGLYLLRAARELDDPGCLELAWRAGKRLVELGKPEHGGLKWPMSARFPRLMPNFSHGTAGVCYFLATLFQWTREQAFLDAALAGARYLRAAADTAGGACRVFHHEPGGTDLYYLSWCHGPPGTARLFYRLYQATGDRAWLDWVHRCARAVLDSGIPARRTPGFWNNVGQCCGSAGVGEFFLALHRVAGDGRYLEFAERMAADVLGRATPDGGGLKWVQAEHRVKPDEVVAQTGYMQGASGVGLFLFRLDACKRGKPPGAALPDSPF
jgi:lantibiotic modifying enzyme